MGKAGRFVAGREAQCDGKESYASRTLAEKVVKRRQRFGQPSVHVYRCPHCAGFHIGGSHQHDDRKRKAGVA